MFHFNWEEVRLKLAVQGQRGRRMLDVDGGQEGRGVGGGGGSWKFYNFHGRHMCIVPYGKLIKLIKFHKLNVSPVS